MWIKHIILENFASVKVGMKVNKVEIDFSKRKNKICLLTAPNGTGKTSLLSTFTPFASLGNLDVRDSENLILDGKSGYKEITIIDGMNEYLIKHFYSPNKDSHSVKSYISKNGEELNINGNVRSFQAIVESELGIEIGYLKLIRLGNNVTNLLQLTATERKKFLSNLLQDLDVYLNYYKKLTDDSRLLKTQISHVTDKLKRTGIDDVDEAKKSLEFLSDEIKKQESTKDQLLLTLGSLKSSLNEINKEDLKEEKKVLEKKYKKAQNALSETESVKTLSFYEDSLKKEKENIDTRTNLMQNLMDSQSIIFRSIDDALKESADAEREYTRVLSQSGIESAKEVFDNLIEKERDQAPLFKNLRIFYTKDELEHLISSLMQIDQILNLAYEFGEGPINRVADLMQDEKNVQNYINNGLLESTSSSDRSSELLKKFIDGVDGISPECDHTKCGLYGIWVEVKNLLKQEEVKRNANDTGEFYKYMDVVYQRLTKCIDIIGTEKGTIQKLPNERKEDFLVDKIFKRIKRLKPIVDLSKYNELLTEVTEYENYLVLKDQIKEADLKYQIALYDSNIDALEKRVDDTSKKVKSYQKKREELSKDIETVKDYICAAKVHADYYENMVVALTEIEDIKSKLSSIDESLDKYSELISEISDTNSHISDVERYLEKSKKDQMNISYAIKEHESLKAELDKYMKLYNENFFIKRAMSSKEGIPLEFINIYMSNIQTKINEILDIVYDGDLVIDDFKINADEFRIPYIKDGYLIPDIAQASQGERSFLSMALSLALISESILKYNIILLDEIDGNLDDEKRKKFISILDHLIEMIDGEQIFLISHNNLFSMYPVDVVSLDGDVDFSMTLANYIPIKKD